MKKLILFFVVLTTTSFGQIATKDLGVDTLTGLNQRINVWQITIDAKAERVVVVYNIETLAPTGVIVAVSENNTYIRYNAPSDMRFDALASSQIGQLIKGLINHDLLSYPNLDQ